MTAISDGSLVMMITVVPDYFFHDLFEIPPIRSYFCRHHTVHSQCRQRRGEINRLSDEPTTTKRSDVIGNKKKRKYFFQFFLIYSVFVGFFVLPLVVDRRSLCEHFRSRILELNLSERRTRPVRTRNCYRRSTRACTPLPFSTASHSFSTFSSSSFSRRRRHIRRFVENQTFLGAEPSVKSCAKCRMSLTRSNTITQAVESTASFGGSAAGLSARYFSVSTLSTAR